MTATAPFCPTASLATPISNGKMVPPNRPMIIRPEISFFFSGTAQKGLGEYDGKDIGVAKTYQGDGSINDGRLIGRQ